MSAIVKILTNQYFLIATDTLGYKHFKDGSHVKCEYLSKIQYFPIQKTCIVSMGYSRLKSDLYKFIHERPITNDIEGLVENVKNHFLSFLDLSKYRFTEQPGMTANELGNLEFFGYSVQKQRLVHYRLELDRDKVEVFEELNIQDGESIVGIHPMIKKETRDALFANGTTRQSVIVDIMKQMYQDSVAPDSLTPLLGGEVIITMITADPHFACTFYTAHEFEDFKTTLKVLQENALLKSIKENKHNLILQDKLAELLQSQDFGMVANSFDMTSLDKNAQLFITLQNNIIKDLHAFASKMIDNQAGK